jgi:plastocyanin
MLMRALLLIGLSLLVACNNSAGPVSGSRNFVGPSSVPRTSTDASPTAAVAQTVPREDVIVNAIDACDPASFNAAIGAGTCVRAGGLKFDDFIAQLTKLGFVGPWHFAPNTVNARTGQEFLVINHGGEVHTFTEVEAFGGGIVASLNELAHVPNVAPECLALEADDFVAPGQTYREDIEEEGVEKYQCCIHPWMRLEARISEGHHQH